MKGALALASILSVRGRPAVSVASAAVSRTKSKKRFDGAPPPVRGAGPITMPGRAIRTSTPARAPAVPRAASEASFTRS